MMRRTSRWSALTLFSTVLFACLSLAATSAFAQATTSGTVVGVVKDATGALVVGATIVASDTTSNNKYTTVTDKDGAFVMSGVAPSTYTVTATKQGFETDRIDSQPVAVGSQTTLNFALAIGSESTTIEVQATNADLQTMNATVGDTVNQLQITNLPSVARDVSTFASLQPGVAPGGQVAGSVADQAVFMLDGGNNSSDMDGSMLNYTGSFAGDPTGGNIGGSSSGVMPMPQDSMEEFRVATSGQTADFDQSSGFQVQAVTKRGTNQYHGTAYETYLDSSFGANTWSKNLALTPKSIYHFNRFGAAAGGPIAPNFLGGKTYIFGNFEGYRYPLAATYERVVPSLAFTQGNITLGSTLYTAAQIKADDPRGLGLNPTVAAFWQKYEPQQNQTYSGGHFDPTGCGTLASSVTCDAANTFGYISPVKEPITSNFFVLRLDHDFGSKEHFFASYRYFNLIQLTTNQVDIGGYFAGDTLGQATATDPRPQDPWYFVTGLTTNISSSFTNTVHYSYLRNRWQWEDKGAPPPTINGQTLGAALEPGGESATTPLAPITTNNQNIRTRIWDGHDHFLGDDLSKLKGNHLIQFGGQFQHNFAFHNRTDNGGTVNYYPVYQLGETGSAGAVTTAGFLNGLPGSNSTNARLLAMNLGIVTDSQQVVTRSGSLLTLNPPLTPAFDQVTMLYYNMYITDTWHVLPSLTVNYGLGYTIELPPKEATGKQVALVDGGDNPIVTSTYLANRATAASLGQVYNPELGFALVGNTANGGTKYPYTPFYKQFAPRLSVAWNPHFSGVAGKIFGESATVVRGGYGRVYGRLNGVGLVLNPLLGPGLIQSLDCQNPLINGTCGSTSTETTNFRIGTDGPSAALPAVSTNLPQPFYPGYNGAASSSASVLDPTLRPSSVDSFNLTLQRQVTRKTLVEVGYIGRRIKNEFEGIQLDSVPYMLSIGGQTFAKAYLALEQAYGCTVSIGLCLANTNNTTYHASAVAPQPFFETALAGSKYCNTALYASCTAGVVAIEGAKNYIQYQKVWNLFSDLDNGGFTFPGYSRIMTQTPIPTSQGCGTFCTTGQLGTGVELTTSAGYANYNGGFLSFKATNFHGITAQENFTYSKALGLNDAAQSSSSLVPNDGFDLRKSYGPQGYNQKFIFNTFVVYQPEWYKTQAGIIGRLLGGWTISPIFTAGSGQPRTCTDFNSGSQAFGEGDTTFGDNEQCVFTTPYKGGYGTNRNATGGLDPYGNSVGQKASSVPGGAANSCLGTYCSINGFSNPVAVWNTVRPPILGMDEHDGGDGPIQGFPYWNMDLRVSKNLKVWEKTSLEFSAVSTNVFNHLVFANGSLSLASNANWGEVTGQNNSPRQIQMAVRASF